MKPGVYNIRPQRRADYVMNVVFKDSEGTELNLTGWQVLAQVWNKERTTKYADFTVTVTDAVNGAVSLKIPYTATATLPDECRYDVMLINGSGQREYYLEGIVRPSPGYTAPA